MKINKTYLHLFKKGKFCYLYQLFRGVYLSFDAQDLTYTGIECFYLPKSIDYLESQAEKKLNTLFVRGILELL